MRSRCIGRTSHDPWVAGNLVGPLTYELRASGLVAGSIMVSTPTRKQSLALFTTSRRTPTSAAGRLMTTRGVPSIPTAPWTTTALSMEFRRYVTESLAAPAHADPTFPRRRSCHERALSLASTKPSSLPHHVCTCTSQQSPAHQGQTVQSCTPAQHMLLWPRQGTGERAAWLHALPADAGNDRVPGGPAPAPSPAPSARRG